MLLTSFALSIVVLILSHETSLPQTILMEGTGALAGIATELFSPGEYDTITVPVMMIAALLLL